jgi:hypothetical protein
MRRENALEDPDSPAWGNTAEHGLHVDALRGQALAPGRQQKSQMLGCIRDETGPSGSGRPGRTPDIRHGVAGQHPAPVEARQQHPDATASPESGGAIPGKADRHAPLRSIRPPASPLPALWILLDPSSQRLRHDLMPEADPEHRDLPLAPLPHRLAQQIDPFQAHRTRKRPIPRYIPPPDGHRRFLCVERAKP